MGNFQDNIHLRVKLREDINDEIHWGKVGILSSDEKLHSLKLDSD